MLQVNMIHSVGVYRDAVQLAIDRNNKDMVETILKAEHKPADTRVKSTRCLMSTIGTGTYNYRSLGVRHIQQLCQSRGTREGNNALLKVYYVDFVASTLRRT